MIRREIKWSIAQYNENAIGNKYTKSNKIMITQSMADEFGINTNELVFENEKLEEFLKLKDALFRKHSYDPINNEYIYSIYIAKGWFD